ncbi:ABC transporter transmembrane domain protein [Fusarium subglutinans]|uniref:ABC transporter transmembrane domain protein n=1 Tax=Gibberella subglutinans TaxID=42677 RepID=A0A8H5PSY6_GIBSU|nr:ABC transporter transmembrane domain protein [Fusarium subglutinans]KAF5602442.1 ABC transporter transmembrane domain protein [Fusarium subglutinans]
MSFGYSVGDVIAGANLTYRLIRIMADTEGGSDEYVEAMSELAAMQQAFLQISEIRNHKMLPPATVNAASHIVLSSMDTIAKFLERTKQYQRRLEDPRISSFQSSWHKIGWTLYKSHELRTLRDALHSRLTSVQVLLSAASYCTPLPANVARYQAADQNSHGPSIAEASPAPPHSPASGSDHERDADVAEKNHKGSSLSSPSPEQKFRTIQTSEGSSLRQFIHFKDAVGRKFNFPWEKSRKWSDLEDLIKQAFDQVDVLGPHVIEGHYDLIGPDGKIILPSIWEDIVEPDMDIIMTMWPVETINKPPLLPRVRPPRPPPIVERRRNQGPGNPPPRREFMSDTPGMQHWRDDRVRVTAVNTTRDASHRSSRTPEVLPLPIPSTPHAIAQGHITTPGSEIETCASSKESRYRHPQPGDARDSQEPRPKQRLMSDEEFIRRISGLDAITKPAVMEIIKEMEKRSRITQAQSKEIIKSLEIMPLDSFEDSVRAYQAEMSSQQIGPERSSSRDSPRGSSPVPTYLRDTVDKGKAKRREREEDGLYSADGQDHDSVAPTSDWEDYTEDEETITEDGDDDPAS